MLVYEFFYKIKNLLHIKLMLCQ